MQQTFYLMYVNLEFGDSSDFSRHLYSDLTVAKVNMARQLLEARRHFIGAGRMVVDKPMCQAWAGDDGRSYAIGIREIELEEY